MPTLQYDGLITIATGSSRRSASWKTKEMLWSEFVDKLGRVTRTQETQQEYFRMPKEERDNAKDVGGFVGGLVFGLLGLSATGFVGNLIVSVVGACVCIWVGRKLFR